MKQKITKGKVVQNCLKVTAAVALAGGVGFQFHEINNLNKDIDILEDKYSKSVQELKLVKGDLDSVNQLNDDLKKGIKSLEEKEAKLNKQLDSLQKEKESLDKENKNLKSSVSQKDAEIATLKKQVSP